MTATAPITQDVHAIPRKLPEGPVNLVGLTRDQMRAAFPAAGTPEKQARMRVGQVWQWVYHWGVRDFGQMTNLAKDYRALLAQHFVIALPEIVSSRSRRTAPASIWCASVAATRWRPSTSPRRTAARSASPPRWAAR
jgi:hypothetical protein